MPPIGELLECFGHLDIQLIAYNQVITEMEA